MSKRLPRTSRRTLDDLRKAANSAIEAEKPPLRTVPEESPDAAPGPAGEPDANLSTNRASTAKASADESPAGGSAAHKDGDAQAQDGTAAGRALVSPKPERPDKDAFRKASARLIVERHSNLAAMAGLVPMPWVELAAITVTVDSMLRKLARLYGEPLDRNRSRQLATAMLTGMAAPGIASFATTGLLRMTPGPHLVGMAITAVSAAVIVRVVGEVYLSRLTGEHIDFTVAAREPAQA